MREDFHANAKGYRAYDVYVNGRGEGTREIKEVLSRQVLVLEPLWLNFMQKATLATRPEQHAALTKTAMSSLRALNAALSALTELNDREKNAQAIPV